MDNDLTAKARAWVSEDPDPATRTQLERLVERVESGDDVAVADLADRFSGVLEFGTAGLRGALGAGPMRMNRVVVIRAAAGLAAYLHREHPGRPSKVVIGFDARHNSDMFAADTAAVMVGAGHEAYLMPAPWPTPLLAFSVRHLGADAGVMVTASHNPPQDNGYKVYLGGPGEEGSLIVPPTDGEIASCIAAVGALDSVPRAESGWTTLGEEIRQAYLSAVSADLPPFTTDLRIVLTPMHGVGGETAVEALRSSGFHQVSMVSQQAQPDPDFPTVPFPNPEEPGAIDLALAAAREASADLVIALDPDADRCAAAILDPAPGGDTSAAGWRMLRGDELGSLLGQFMADRRADGDLDRPDAPRTLARSIVSSTQLAKIAEQHGLTPVATLTGFKWISRAPDLLFGYEEALGLCPRPDVTRDKDGIASAVLTCVMAARLADEGKTLVDGLDQLALTYGLHANDQLSVRVEDLSLIGAAMSRLRSAPPTTLADSPVVETVDLAEGYQDLPPTDGMLLRTAAADQVVARPSGTEPKLKCYLEVVVPVPDGDVNTARHTATQRLATIKSEMATALGI